MVSFDKDNFHGRFDLQILNRVDNCTDFIIILDKETFSSLSPDDPDTDMVIKMSDCSAEEFSDLELKLNRVDFVRIELARAIKKNKNIIPIVPADTPEYKFCELKLSEDIALLTKYQSVSYNESDNSFLFQDIVPKVVKKLETKPKGVIKRLHLGFSIPAFVISALVLLTGIFVIKDIISYKHCGSFAEYQDYYDYAAFPALFKKNALSKIGQIEGIEKDLRSLQYFSNASFSNSITLTQAEVIYKIASKMKYAPGGKFQMGTDDPKFIKERPAHKETVEDFLISKYEVSEDEWFGIMGGKVSRVNYPITNISWYDAISFCEKLESLCGLPFRLPLEKEWEYAAGYNGDCLYSGSSTPDEVAWYAGREDAGDSPHIRKDPSANLRWNGLELYDMSGNVAEWCNDSFALYGEKAENDDVKVIRGGSVKDPANKVRITYRDPVKADIPSPYIGFRLVLSKLP